MSLIISKIIIVFITALIFFSMIYSLNVWSEDYSLDCNKEKYTEKLCGDFGYYHLKLIMIFGSTTMCIMFLLIILMAKEVKE